jgi:hypothetical protein
MTIDHGFLRCEGVGTQESSLPAPSRKMKRKAPAVLGREKTAVFFNSMGSTFPLVGLSPQF